tara:strand:- start:1008 stop:1598 length:591 start_codon:yes stop_codon:yes gene_type:complete
MKWLKDLYYWTLNFADKKYNTAALSAVSFTEASFFLIPPEVLFLPMAASRPKRALYYSFLMSLFSVLGGIFGYWLGMSFWHVVSPYFFDYVFSVEKFDEVRVLFNDHSFETLFIAGFTPIPFKIFTIAAGVVNTPFGLFVMVCTLARTLRYFILGGLFYFYGPKIRSWIEDNFEKATLGIGLLLVVLVVAIKILRH